MKKLRNFIIIGYIVLIIVLGGISIVMQDIGIAKFDNSYRIAITILAFIGIAAAIYYTIDNYYIDDIKRYKRLKKRKDKKDEFDKKKGE